MKNALAYTKLALLSATIFVAVSGVSFGAFAAPEKMDVGTHRFLIEKLEAVLDSTPKGDSTRVPALLRLADLVIVPENPLQNLKTLYGTGHMRLNDTTNRQEKVGGVKYTIKDGIVYDAPKLLAEVQAMVAAEKARLGGGGPTAGQTPAP